MITPITATFPALNFPKEVDYPTQEDWAAFSAAAELNYGILSGEWSTKSQEFKSQTNNLALEIQQIGENAINAISLDTIEDLATYTGTGLVMVKDINRGGTFISKTAIEIDTNTGSLYATNNITVFAKAGGGFWARDYNGAVDIKWAGAKGDGNNDDIIPIQNTLNLFKNIHFPDGIYVVSNSPVIKEKNTSLSGFNVEIRKITKNLSGLPDSNGKVFNVDATLIIDGERVESTIYKYDISIEGIKFTRSGSGIGGDYAIYAPLCAFLNIKNCKTSGTKYGFFTYNSWMSSIVNATFEASINPVFIGGGTSFKLEKIWALGAVSDYAYRIENLMYSTFLNCASDYIGTSIAPSAGIFNISYSNITILNSGCEKGHINRLSYIHQSKINFDSFTMFEMVLHPASDLYLISTQGSELTFTNCAFTETTKLINAISPTVDISNFIFINCGNVASVFSAVSTSLPSSLLVLGEGGIKSNGNSNTASGITTNSDIKIISTSTSDESKELSFINLDGTLRKAYIKGNFSSHGAGTVTTLTFGANAASSDAVDVCTVRADGLVSAVDGGKNLGSAGSRWGTVYASTGTINTSDDREKTYLEITNIEKKVALELKANMRKFQFNDAIAEKGKDNARIHFGASAQTVKSIFEKHGLNAFDYAILCYDEWKDEYENLILEDAILDDESNIIKEAITKNKLVIKAGNRYGLRYDELLCFIIGAI